MRNLFHYGLVSGLAVLTTAAVGCGSDSSPGAITPPLNGGVNGGITTGMPVNTTGMMPTTMAPRGSTPGFTMISI